MEIMPIEMLKLVWMALLLDLFLGDPRWLPHPVVAMGWVIQKGESLLRRLFRSRNGLRFAGALLTLGLAGGVYAFIWMLVAGAGRYHPYCQPFCRYF